MLNNRTGGTLFGIQGIIQTGTGATAGTGQSVAIHGQVKAKGDKAIGTLTGAVINMSWGGSEGASSNVGSANAFTVAAVTRATAGTFTNVRGIITLAQPDFVANAFGAEFADSVTIGAQAASGDRVARTVLELTQSSGSGAAGAHINMNDKGGDPATPATGDVWRSGGIVKFFDGLDVGGAFHVPIVAKTGTYTLTDDDHTVTCDTSGGGFTINLPALSGRLGRIYNVKNDGSSTNAITVDGNGAETIDGFPTKVIIKLYANMQIQAGASEWHIL